MARKKQFDHYPKEYTLLFRMAATKPIRIACDSPEQAHSVRNDLYTFRSVLKDLAEANNEARELALLAYTVSLSITDRTLTAEPIRGN